MAMVCVATILILPPIWRAWWRRWSGPPVTSDSEWLNRFLHEVRTARTVAHPNVCRVHDIFEASTESGVEFQFLTMEYVDGENLSSLMRRSGRLPPAKALEIAGQITAGPAAVHSHDIVHRDIKPTQCSDRCARAGQAGRFWPGCRNRLSERQGIFWYAWVYIAPGRPCPSRTRSRRRLLAVRYPRRNWLPPPAHRNH